MVNNKIYLHEDMYHEVANATNQIETRRIINSTSGQELLKEDKSCGVIASNGDIRKATVTLRKSSVEF